MIIAAARDQRIFYSCFFVVAAALQVVIEACKAGGGFPGGSGETAIGWGMISFFVRIWGCEHGSERFEAPFHWWPTTDGFRPSIM